MECESVIYLDNAATTWPKPESVAEAMKRCVAEYGANPGRGSYRLSRQAGETVEKTRSLLARLFRVDDPNNIFFCANGTHAINQALKGVLNPGDHVITTCWEHNAVTRPLEILRKEVGIAVTHVPAGKEGTVDLAEVEKAVRPETRMILSTHASNVTGAVLPIESLGRVARKNGVWFLVDAAQTAGVLDIDVQQMGIDLLAFPGHKGLFGPQGTGGLYVNPEIPMVPVFQGGTGIRSESVEQPFDRPTGFESGTVNTPGIAGLGAGIQFLQETGIERIHRHEMKVAERLREGLKEIPGVTLYPSHSVTLPLISFNMEGLDGNEAAVILDQHYDIAVRAGFHCAAVAHRTLQTEVFGTIRVSPGYFNTLQEAEAFLEAVREIGEAFAGV
ncbi:aminotransferase class V-fold PLP-dependent enzyme [Paludifilum halophilum]|uniref:cysteine desulfurase n=1 Tax=Paludifilum halophilum TaxID=1642702 RepID=A0A235B6K1_9BACL|nr:aminotransferase class V-fold PLP-dependent enzyme [Paludifilum halophilum]OYD07928.1 cysteine desulfurase [Paludifilum halophilum]